MDLETVVSSPETPELIKILINEHLNILYIISLINPGTYVHRLSAFFIIIIMCGMEKESLATFLKPNHPQQTVKGFLMKCFNGVSESL